MSRWKYLSGTIEAGYSMSKPHILLAASGSLRSKKFEIRDGEYATLSGHGLCPGMCVKISEVIEDKCRCIYDEKPFCIFGNQVGLDQDCTTAVIPMPGCYIAYVCLDDGLDPIDLDYAIYLNVGKDLQNLQVVVSAACCGAK